MIIAKTRKWGSSIGIVIPKNIAQELKIRENQEVYVTVKPKVNPLKELFGIGKGKVAQSTEEILKESRKNISKYF